jgi:four helix bundle protein
MEDGGWKMMDADAMDDAPFGYKKLRIWQAARELVNAIHRMSLENLPKFELYEEGSQIRRIMKSVKSNIVEGHGRRRYKAEDIRFLDFSYASCLETIDHLETLHESGSLQEVALFEDLVSRASSSSPFEVMKEFLKFARSARLRQRARIFFPTAVPRPRMRVNLSPSSFMKPSIWIHK